MDTNPLRTLEERLIKFPYYESDHLFPYDVQIIMQKQNNSKRLKINVNRITAQYWGYI